MTKNNHTLAALATVEPGANRSVPKCEVMQSHQSELPIETRITAGALRMRS